MAAWVGTVPSRVRAARSRRALILLPETPAARSGSSGVSRRSCGRGIAAEVLAHAAVDGGGGLAVQLLVDDRFEQRLEGRGSRIEAQREGAGAIDELGELGVGGLEMGDGLIGIEGEFAAVAVVNHGRSVSHKSADSIGMSGCRGCRPRQHGTLRANQ